MKREKIFEILTKSWKNGNMYFNDYFSVKVTEKRADEKYKAHYYLSVTDKVTLKNFSVMVFVMRDKLMLSIGNICKDYIPYSCICDEISLLSNILLSVFFYRNKEKMFVKKI